METSREIEASRSHSKKGFKRVYTLPFLAFCGVTFLLVAYLCQSAQLVRAEYEVLSKQQDMKVLEAEKADLELKVQELTSLERVERVAVTKLGMIVPQERQVLEVVWVAQKDGGEMAAVQP